MFWLGLIVGLMIGYELNKYAKDFKKRGNINIFGLEVKFAGVTPEVKKKTKVTAAKNKCNLCNGEDMFISGTKELIPCPECKRNKNKFKTLTI